jgi:phosphoribosylanthranilate isomerase
MKVKICGITNLEDAATCEGLGADALGFVHFPGRMRSLPLDEIANICSSLGPMTTKVLVCSPTSAADALRMVALSKTDVVQLYTFGPETLNEVRQNGVKVIRAVSPTRSEAERFVGAADALLFEQGAPGTGTSYDYSQVPVDFCPRAIIAGGLDPGNLDRAKELRPYALDVSSGVERTPGRKDPDLVEKFIRRCRS